MRVLLVGGIFGSSTIFRRRNLQQTTETLLAEALPAYGFDVSTASHRSRFDVFAYDIIHVHHLATGCVRLLVQLFSKPWRRRPTIVFTRHATKPLPWSHKAILRLMQRYSDALVTLSTQEREMVAGQTKRPRKVHVIPNGIDASHFPHRPRSVPPRGKPWRLLYVGQLIELKRVDIAIRALAMLHTRGCSAELHIVSHRDTLRPELEAVATELGISQYVKFHPPATRYEVGEHMQNAHLLLLPSRTEASPTVIIEAGLTGLPTIAFDVGGVRALLPPNTEVHAAHEVDAYVTQVGRYLEDYEVVCSRFNADRPRLEQQHSIAAMTEGHANLYRQLVQSRRNRDR